MTWVGLLAILMTLAAMGSVFWGAAHGYPRRAAGISRPSNREVEHGDG